MGFGKFCTNIAVQDPDTGAWMQLRPRLPPNLPLLLTSFGQTAPVMKAQWQPGAHVGIEWSGPPPILHQRATHPEDYLFRPGGTVLYAKTLTPPEFRQLAQQFQRASVRELFPPILWQASGKGYVANGEELTQSVGYVPCTSVTREQGNDASVITQARERFTVAIKDHTFLAQPPGTVLRNVLVRFSLANAWDGGAMGFSPERCHLMLSHIVP
jgi:hypothetical protein